jgi:hypothetical protein
VPGLVLVLVQALEQGLEQSHQYIQQMLASHSSYPWHSSSSPLDMKREPIDHYYIRSTWYNQDQPCSHWCMLKLVTNEY